jgi:protein LTV1
MLRSKDFDDASDDSFESYNTDRYIFISKIANGFRPKKASSTAFSMSSSSMYRNDKLTLLDDQFDQLMAAEYSDEELGELDPENDHVLGDKDLNDPVLDGLYDSFLENLHIIGSGRRLVTRNPQESLDAIRKELKEDAKVLLGKYGYEEDFIEGDFRMPEPKKKSEWDVESVISTNSNIYNRPKLIQEISKGVPKFKLSRGIPQVIPEESEEDLDENGSNVTEKPAGLNKGISRPAKETLEEKKARKNAVKEERRSRRTSKKATKLAFHSEQAVQLKQLPNIKLQAHSVVIS